MGCICQKQHGIEEDSQTYVEFGKYIGERNCCGQRNGKGQYYYDNGDMYDGFWKRNKKHGFGCYTFFDGRVLEGFFEDDKYIGELAPSVVDEDEDDPLPSSAGSRRGKEPIIRRAPDNDNREERRKQHQKKIEELKKKYGVRET